MFTLAVLLLVGLCVIAFRFIPAPRSCYLGMLVASGTATLLAAYSLSSWHDYKWTLPIFHPYFMVLYIILGTMVFFVTSLTFLAEFVHSLCRKKKQR